MLNNIVLNKIALILFNFTLVTKYNDNKPSTHRNIVL